MKLTTVKRILKKGGFKRASPEDRVSAVLPNLQSTHDAVFVFSGEKFSGTVNLYYSFINKRVSPNEKLKNCLYHPPVITPETSLLEASRLMVESRVYILPVIDKGKFLGAVFAENILNLVKKWDLFDAKVKQALSPRKLVFVDLNASVSQALSLMIKNGINRLLVEDKNGSLLGILALFDLRKVFTTPKERISFLTRIPIKKELAGQPIKKFYRGLVISVEAGESLNKAVSLMRQNNIGSLVVFSEGPQKKPVGLITFRDLLKFVADLGKKKGDVSFIHQFNRENLRLARENSLKRMNRLLQNNALLASRIKSISLNLREIAKAQPQVRLPLMEATALVRFYRGNKVIRTKVQGRKVVFIVDKIINRVKSLARKQKK
ncbi:MAG: CBS domain-containing protein [Patescibacteria group bacterium]|nr:CBS domain-containing protein [Patescibacteria group bacterium]